MGFRGLGFGGWEEVLGIWALGFRVFKVDTLPK